MLKHFTYVGNDSFPTQRLPLSQIKQHTQRHRGATSSSPFFLVILGVVSFWISTCKTQKKAQRFAELKGTRCLLAGLKAQRTHRALDVTTLRKGGLAFCPTRLPLCAHGLQMLSVGK